MDAKVIWQGGMQFVGSSESGHEVTLAAKGEEGIGPMEMVLTALAGCTSMDVISILEKKKQKVTSFEVHTHGERAADHPKVFTSLNVHYIVRGEGIDPAAVERAIELSETKYCPVGNMLGRIAPLTHSYEIVEEVAEPV